MGGLVFWWALEAQGVAAATFGLLGLKLSGAWLVLHLLASIVIGAGFGAICRYQPMGLGSTISVGLLYGLLWWIAGPITIGGL